MEPQNPHKKRTRLFLIIGLVAVISISLFVVYDLSRPKYGPSWTYYSWTSALAHYNGFSAAGTFVETPDLHYTIVGTAANGAVKLIQTSSQMEGDLLRWQRTYGNGSGNAVSFANEGFIVAGEKTLEKGQNVQNRSWLIKTDSQGNQQWSRTYQGLGLNAVVNASDGGFVALGHFNVTGVERPGLLKVDSAGNLQWVKTYTSSEANVLKLTALIQTIDGGYGLVGEMQYSTHNITIRNGWFVKTDANGEIQINRPFSMNGACVLRSVVQADDGGYLLAGATSDSVNGTYSACLIGTDWDGHSQWSRVNSTLADTVGGNGFEYYTAAKTMNGSYIVIGYLNGFGATEENVDSAGNTLEYEIKADSPQINYAITTIQTIHDNETGYAFAGYKEGAVWLYTKTPVMTVIVT
jgi:hypothetical protein